MNSKALLATTALILALSTVSCGKENGESSASISETIQATSLAETTEETIIMPDLYGMDYNEAISLYGNQIQFKMESSEYNEIDAGLIFEQDIEPGKNFKHGDTLKVKVSKGMDMVKVPNLTGFARELAQDQLKQRGLEYEIENSASAEVQQGYVIKTEPEADTEVKKGETIVLYVSMGVDSGQVSVDNYVGQLADDAVTLAEYAGLKPVTEFKESDGEKGTVIEQSIENGASVDVGTEITFYISDYTE